MKERLLLHCCCAPCSVAIMEELKDQHDLVLLFYNPNIHPTAEYERRKAEVLRIATEWGIATFDHDTDEAAWETAVASIPQATEGGSRCSACYRLRLRRTAAVAKIQGIATFATSLSSGRQKNSAVVNAIGRLAAAEYGVSFLDVDWKKGGRQERSGALARQLDLYRQDYCGCRFSLAERHGVKTNTAL